MKKILLLFSLLLVVASLSAKPILESRPDRAGDGAYLTQNQSSVAGQVTFYGNGGLGTMEPIEGLSEGQEIQLPRCTFVREGYRFVGWTNTPGSDEPVYQDEYARFPYYPSNSALYAVWEPEASALRISFDANGGEGTMESIYVRANQVIIVPPHRFMPDDEGYECKGYGLAPDDYNRYRIGGTASFTRSCTLYAFWSPLNGSIGGACEEFKGQSVFVEGVHIAPEDWVQVSETPLKVFAEWKEGCGWYDVDQDWLNFCWAGTCSNAIHWWLDRNEEYIKEYKKTHEIQDFKYYGKGVSDVFRFFNKHWLENKGGLPSNGFDWFINGIDDYVQESAKGKGGIFKEVFGSNSLVSKMGSSINRRIFNDFIVNALKNKCMLSIDETNMSGSHAFTCWGAEFDEEGYICAIYYTDSATPWNNMQTGRDLSLGKIAIKYNPDKNWKPYMETTVVVDGEIQHGEIPIVGIYSYSQGTEYWEAYFASQGQEHYTLLCQDEDGKTFATRSVSVDPGASVEVPAYPFRTVSRAMAGDQELTIGADGTIGTTGIAGSEITLYYADRVPFETTTVAEGGFADAHWYLLSGSDMETLGMMQYDAQNQEHIRVATLTEGNLLDDANLWCIGGSVTDGFRLYNKAAGASLAVAYTDGDGLAAMQSATTDATVWAIVAATDEDDSTFGFQSRNAIDENSCLHLTDSEVAFGPADSRRAVLKALTQTEGWTLSAAAFESLLQRIPSGAVGGPVDRAATAQAIETLKGNPTEANYRAVCAEFENQIELSADKVYRLIGADTRSDVSVHADGFLRVGETDGSDASGLFWLEPLTDGGYQIEVQGEYLGAARSNNANNDFGLEGRSLNGSKIKKGEFAVISATNARVYLQNTNTEAAGATYVHLNGQTVAGCGDRVRGTLWYLVEESAMSITIGESGYATAHYPFAVQLPQSGGLKAYIGSVNADGNDREVVLHELADGWVPARTAVVLVGEPGVYSLPVLTDKAPGGIGGNTLSGTLLPVSVTGNDYTLNYRYGVAAFYKVDVENLQVEANKAYLPGTSIPASAQGADKFVFTFGGVAGIDSITVGTGVEEEYYDLQGRRVLNPTRGIYVTKSGKKVLITR